MASAIFFARSGSIPGGSFEGVDVPDAEDGVGAGDGVAMTGFAGNDADEGGGTSVRGAGMLGFPARAEKLANFAATSARFRAISSCKTV